MKIPTSLTLLGLSAAVFTSQVLGQTSRPIGNTSSDPTVKVYKTIDGTELKINLFGLQPESGTRSPRPAIVFFFGGGWRSGTTKQFEHHARYLARRGMIAATADYRVSSRHQSRAIDSVEDAKSAIRWLRQNAEDLGIAPNRIVASGGSAGGHLAACTGVIPGLGNHKENLTISSRPNALVLFNPAVVLASIPGHPEFSAERLASLKERMGVRPINLSPIHYVKSATPPTIIFHGQADTTVPYWTAEAFQQAQVTAGGRSKLVGFPGEGHGFFNFGRRKNNAFRETLKATDSFLQSLDYLEGPDTVDDYLQAIGSTH